MHRVHALGWECDVELRKLCWDLRAYLCRGQTWLHGQREHYRLLGIFCPHLPELGKWPKLLNAARQKMETIMEERTPGYQAWVQNRMKDLFVVLAPLIGFL